MNKLQRSLAIVLMTGITALSVGTVMADPQYTITDLGSQYTPRFTMTTPTGINNLGQVAVTFSVGGSGNHIGRFENRTITDLGNLGNPSSVTTAINDQGDIVGWSANANSERHAFLYDSTGMHDLFAPDTGTSSATGINNHDDIIGISTSMTSGFLIHNGVMTQLPVNLGASSQPNDINDLGDIVGTYNSTVATAYLLHNGVAKSLGSLGTQGKSNASAINNAGQIVGNTSTDTDTVLHGALFSNGQITDLGTLGGNTYATAINSAGQIVGLGYDASGKLFALLFGGTTPTPLNTLIDSLSGWNIADAVSINDAGVILVQALRNNIYHSLLLTPNVAATAIPSPPTNVAATVWDSSEINITWNIVPGAASYKIYRGTTQGGTKSLIATAHGESTFDDSLLQAATRYYYTVTAVNQFGESAQSAEAAATTRAAAPMSVTNLKAVSLMARQIQVSWDPAGAATQYEVLRTTTFGSNYISLGLFPFGTKSIIDGGLNPNTTYYYSVIASNSYGAAPETRTFATTLRVSPPDILSVKGISGSQIKISWDNNDAAPSHAIFRSSVSNQFHQYIGTSTGSTFTDSGLQLNTRYYYIVTAVYSDNTNVRSAEVSGTTQNIPITAPTLTATTVNCTRIHLAWNSVAAATSYIVYRAATAGGTHSYVGTSTTTQYDETGLAPSTTGYYIVIPQNTNGVGPRSNEAHATTSALPTAALNLTATAASKSRIDLHWTAAFGASSYQIFRSSSSGTYHTYIGTTTATQYGSTGLAPSTSYYYIVVSVNANGSGPKSNEAGAKTLAQ